jgi:hypothetical protein
MVIVNDEKSAALQKSGNRGTVAKLEKTFRCFKFQKTCQKFEVLKELKKQIINEADLCKRLRGSF